MMAALYNLPNFGICMSKSWAINRMFKGADMKNLSNGQLIKSRAVAFTFLMKRLLFISLVVVLLGSIDLFAQEKILRTATPKKMTPTKRAANHWSLGVDSGLVSVGGKPLIGVSGNYFLTDSLALETIISRVIDFSTNYGAGVRYYFLSGSAFSPYGFLRAGYLDIDPVTIKFFGKEFNLFKSGSYAASVGPGIQYLFENSIAMQLEVGLTTLEFRGVLGQMNLGIAYFF